jgi:hypothetical protein
MIDPASEMRTPQPIAAAFEPGQNAASRRLKQLELNGTASLLLNHHRAVSNLPPDDKIANLDPHHVDPRSGCRSPDRTSPDRASDLEHGRGFTPASSCSTLHERPFHTMK